jgi:ParB-like chromosome segregation protein Spo0J
MSIDIFDIPPHPAADVFPMLDDDELDELAADIAANGLQLPLVVHELDGASPCSSMGAIAVRRAAVWALSPIT